MARIRSVHPGLWTDEAFVTLSPFARLLAIGIWGECDDAGAFEWKPVQLKMRLLGNDAVDVAALLAEIAAANVIRRYEVGGKAYGLVRNWNRFQSPKKPRHEYPIPQELRTYAGTRRKGGEGEEVEAPAPTPRASAQAAPVGNEGGLKQATVGKEFPTSGVKSPQMERDKEKERISPTPPPVPQPRASDPLGTGMADVYPEPGTGRSLVNGEYLDVAQRRIFEAAEIDDARWRGHLKPLIEWLAEGYVPDEMLPVIRKLAQRPGYKPPTSLAYFDRAIRAECKPGFIMPPRRA